MRGHHHPANGRTLVHTGVYAAIPHNHVGLVCPRSGLALNQGLTVLNAPGIIDSNYRGELCVILHNTSERAVTITAGQRIAQLVITPVAHVKIIPESHLRKTRNEAKTDSAAPANKPTTLVKQTLDNPGQEQS